MPDEPASPKVKTSIPGEAYMGLGIILVAGAMILQNLLFEGEKLSSTGTIPFGLW